MQNPKNAAAGFGVRWIAYIIDCLLVGIISSVILLPVMLGQLFHSGSIWNRQILFDLTLYGILAYCIRAVYFVICTYAFGKTLGKLILRLHVESADGEKLTFVNVLFRETVGRFLSGLLYIGYLIALAGKEHLALHDMLCDTRVCYTNLAEVEQREQQVVPDTGDEYTMPWSVQRGQRVPDAEQWAMPKEVPVAQTLSTEEEQPEQVPSQEELQPAEPTEVQHSENEEEH